MPAHVLVMVGVDPPALVPQSEGQDRRVGTQRAANLDISMGAPHGSAPAATTRGHCAPTPDHIIRLGVLAIHTCNEAGSALPRPTRCVCTSWELNHTTYPRTWPGAMARVSLVFGDGKSKTGERPNMTAA